MARVTITTWMLSLIRLKSDAIMASMAVPSRLTRALSLGIMAGFTDATVMNRMDRLTGETRLPILGNW